MAISHEDLLLNEIPQHMQKYFKGHRLTGRQICDYFRAADVPDSKREKKRIERQEKLRRLHIQIAKDDFPKDQERLIKAMSKEGCAFSGESLKINIYPFFFEEWILDLVKKSERAAIHG